MVHPKVNLLWRRPLFKRLAGGLLVAPRAHQPVMDDSPETSDVSQLSIRQRLWDASVGFMLTIRSLSRVSDGTKDRGNVIV